jgi:hypothetical protein
MKCDSWASFLARTLVSLYLGHELKGRVAIEVVHIFKVLEFITI